MKSLDIHVEHVTRVEGHGNIAVKIKDGRLEECRFDVVEAPRFFEAMLRGRRYDEAAEITSRICGICSIGHVTCSLQATENALGIQPSEQTVLLRKLTLHGETLQSHLLHAYFLAAPDFFGAGSVFPLVATHRPVVERALRMKRLANEFCDLIAGRTTHPCSMVVNGFTRVPKPKELVNLKERLAAMIPDLNATVELCQTLAVPNFQRETEYVSLRRPDEYAFYNGQLVSSDGKEAPPSEYRSFTNEKVVRHSTAKHTRLSRSSYMVGALARFNNNSDLLSPMGKAAAEALNLKAPCYNTFMNTVAQVVECAHAAEDSIRLIDKLLDKGLKEEDRSHPVKAGTGIAAVEVPRGILYHEYNYDEKGHMTDANCIIPTGQNYTNLEDDMRALLPPLVEADKSKEEITLTLEMLARAYDPCISCSTHLVTVDFG